MLFPHAMPSPRRRGPDVRLAVLLSFAVGLLIGVPLTFAAIFLCSPADGTYQRTPAPSYQHPTVRLTSRTKSGPATNASHRHTISAQERFVDGIFWTDLAESLVPKGFGEAAARQWRRRLNATRVLRLEEGCGRMQNRRLTLSGGGASCCRYRRNNDQIQGEIFSFYLARLLAIDNLPPSALARADARTPRWSAAAAQVALAGWSPERPAVLTQFVPDLGPAFIPTHLRDSRTRRLHPEDVASPDIPDLVQWSDLVVFDYLTANLDRVVNNMYNERWNPGMMSEPAHNLARTPAGLLLFLDNESGLLHGYRLLEKYEPFHRALLDAVCVFRRRTVRALQSLHAEGHLDRLLKGAFATRDPGMSEWLPFLPDRTLRTLRGRIAQVLRQVEACRQRLR